MIQGPGHTPSCLVSGPLHWFRDWPNREVPEGAIGVYTIWHSDGRFIYVGMSGRQPRSDRDRWGLYTRLASHARGRRSGDQFCVYVADRLVLPSLTADQISGIAEGIISLDALVRVFVHGHLAYRYTTVATTTEAFELEIRLKGGAPGVAPPFLNGKSPSSNNLQLPTQ
jgi:hypothetical protein